MRDAAGRFLPDFIGVGPGRTGTTWLHRALSGHVDLPLGIKETGFFGVNFTKGMDWYAYHFRRADGSRKIAEVSPYFPRPRARERIKLVLPDCKVICTIRNPVDHAYSVYKLMRHYVWTRSSFEETFATRPHLEEANQYALHLTGWFNLFGRENVLVTRYDELRQSPQRYLDRVCDFVQIPRIPISAEMRRDDVNAFASAPRSRHLARNARNVLFWLRSHRAYRTANLIDRLGIWRYCFGRGEKFGPLSPETEAKLIAHWLPEVERLEALLEWDLSAWKTRRGASAETRDAAAA